MDLENLDISPELREKAKACTTPEELLALAKKEGYKLSDAEMESVSGGRWDDSLDLRGVYGLRLHGNRLRLKTLR